VSLGTEDRQRARRGTVLPCDPDMYIRSHNERLAVGCPSRRGTTPIARSSGLACIAVALMAASGALAAQNPVDTANGRVRLTPSGAADSIHARADTGVQVLTLADALRVAHENNPTFLQTIAAAGAASATLRTAYGQLLPQLSASLFGAYGGSGQTVVSGSFLGASSNYLESQYQVGLNYTMNAGTLLTPAFGRANRNAAEADVSAQGEVLESTVAQLYVTVLEDQAKAALQDSLVADVEAQLAMTRARYEAGSVTRLDSVRAAVTAGQQRVQAIQAHNLAQTDLLRLFQQLGVQQPANVELTGAYAVAPPSFSLDSVLALAHQVNPQVNALRAREHATNVDVARAYSLYTPTLQVSTGVGGYTYQYTNPAFLVGSANGTLAQQFGSCMSLDTLARAAGLPSRNCGATALTPAQAASIRSANQQFPFSFQNVPRAIGANISLPIFDGFQREERVEQARVNRAAARYTERARELQLTADVTAAYLTLTTSVRTVDIQDQNASAARQALALAEERYRLGASTIVDVADARAAYERADNDRISAVYDYHKAFAALETAVGRPLH
jgi:outer membrane protein